MESSFYIKAQIGKAAETQIPLPRKVFATCIKCGREIEYDLASLARDCAPSCLTDILANYCEACAAKEDALTVQEVKDIILETVDDQEFAPFVYAELVGDDLILHTDRQRFRLSIQEVLENA